MKRFDYSIYETSVRIPPPEHHFRKYAVLFQGCHHVVDVGCGRGLFLQELARLGIPAMGIEQNADSVQEANRSGLTAMHTDALDFLRQQRSTFDGAFCSHVIEHLPIEHVVDLLEAVVTALAPQGICVLAFPNPESLTMQLFGFWRDPDHVRFYHGDLIRGILLHYGLSIDFCAAVSVGKAIAPAENGPVTSRSYLPGSALRWALRPFARTLKNWFGITQLANDIGYLRHLRSIGEEIVIVARKPADSSQRI